jgi:hypothetical protein
MAHNSDTSAARHHSETVYHPGPRILVTDRRIETAGRRFPVRELAEIQRIQKDTHPARTVALICGGVELLLAVPLAAFYGAVSVLGVAFVIALGLGGAILVDSRSNPRWMVLVAHYRGQPVTLFSTRNRQEFEQVRRAVLRAVEADDEAWWATDQAVTVAGAPTGRSGSSRARRHPSDRR